MKRSYISIIGLNYFGSFVRDEKRSVLCMAWSTKGLGLGLLWAPHPTLSLCFLQDAGSQQVGFLLGSCGVSLALTTDACQKGLPKAQTGEVATFKGEASQGKRSQCSDCGLC